MRKKTFMATIGTALCMAACVGMLAACGANSGNETPAASANTVTATPAPKEGTIYVRVNPEIAVSYDENGIVSKVEGVNDDGKTLIENADSYIGKECSDVVRNLIVQMNDAGYFTEEVEGEERKIILEIEKGSVMPDENFIGNMVAEVNSYLSSAALKGEVDLEGASDYGDQSVNDDKNTD